MTALKLFHKGILIGTVSNITPEDTFEMSGDIELTAQGRSYSHVFSFLTDEEKISSGQRLPFDESYLDDWALEDETGKRKEIMVPAVYEEDGEVLWRDD